MRWCLESAVLFAAMTAQAFDSEAWLVARAGFEKEAARLRTAYVSCAAAAHQPGENVTVPVESYPDGSIKTTVFAKKAQFFLQEGLIWGQGVKVRQFRRDGSVEAWIDAENCVIDRKARCGWVEGRAKGQYRDEATIEGRGVFFSAEKEFLAVAAEAVVTTPERRLTSVRADYDHKAGVALFDGRVRLKGTEKGRAYDFASDRAFAFLAGTNDLRRVVALGRVTVVSEGRTGACARAVYARSQSKITMYGEGPSAPASLCDNTRRKSKVDGARISFWLDSEQVEIVDSQISVDMKGVKLPKGPSVK
jgi:hypothetical protein